MTKQCKLVIYIDTDMLPVYLPSYLLQIHRAISLNNMDDKDKKVAGELMSIVEREMVRRFLRLNDGANFIPIDPERKFRMEVKA